MHLEQAPPPSQEKTAQTEYGFNKEAITKNLMSESELIHQAINGNIDHIENAGLSENKKAQAEIQRSISVFYDKYYDKEANAPRQEGLQELAEVLASKVEMITCEELQEAAQRVVDKSKSNEIVLVVPDHKLQEADFESPESKNSNEYMAKEVISRASDQGKQVVVVAYTDDLSKYDTVYIVDDAMYSGDQMNTTITEMARRIRKPTNINLHLARATNIGLGKVERSASQNRNITLKTEVGANIKTLSQALEEKPDSLDFFLTGGFSALIKDQRSYIEILEYGKNYVSNTTLTIAEFKMPDFLSVPNVVTGKSAGEKGIEYKGEGALKYPTVNVSES